MLKKGRGSWDDPRARATRGLRRMRRERPGALLARRTRTMKLCSFDARSKGSLGHSLQERHKKSEGPRQGKWHVSACQWVGGCERCAQLGLSQLPLKSDSSLRPCWRAFLSMLRGVSLLSRTHRPILVFPRDVQCGILDVQLNIQH